MITKQTYQTKPEYILADGDAGKIDMGYVGSCLAQKYGVSSPDNAGPTMLGYMLSMKVVEKPEQPKKIDVPTKLGSMLIDDLVLPLSEKSVA